MSWERHEDQRPESTYQGHPLNVRLGRPLDIISRGPLDFRSGRPQDSQIEYLGDALGTLEGDVGGTSWRPTFTRCEVWSVARWKKYCLWLQWGNGWYKLGFHYLEMFLFNVHCLRRNFENEKPCLFNFHIAIVKNLVENVALESSIHKVPKFHCLKQFQAKLGQKKL